MTPPPDAARAGTGSPSPGIRHITYHFPENVLDNDNLRGRFEFDPGFLEEKLGISKRYLASKGQATSEMCAAAVDRLLEETGIDRGSVDALMVVTLNPDYIMPHTAALVQDMCGLPKTVASFDVALGCSGYVYGLSMAKAMMSTHGFSKFILVTAVNFWKITDPKNRNTAPIFGDAATATLLCDEEPRYLIGKTTFGTNGGMRDAIIVPGSGTVPHDGDSYLDMQGREVFNLMMKEVPPDVRRCLEINELTPEQVTIWVFHQASAYMVTNLAKQLRLPMDRIVIDLDDGGNTSSCTIPITLSRRILNQPELPETIGLSGFGVGASWASTFLFKNPTES